MAIAYVQEVGKNTKNTAGSTLVITLAVNANAGDLLLLRGIGGGGVAPSTVADNRGNTWSIDKIHASSPRVFIASTLQDAATLQAGDQITVTFASSVIPAAAIVDEFSGIAAVSRVDQTQTATATTTNRDAGTTGTLSQANELVVAAFGSGTAETASWAHGSGYSDFTTKFLNSTTSIIMVEGQYQIVAATTAVHPTATGVTMSTNGLVVTYKAAGSTLVTSTLSATGTSAPVLSKLPSKIQSVVATSAASKLVNILRSFSYDGAGSAILTRKPTKVFLVAGSGTASLVRLPIKVLLALSTAVVSFVKNIVLNLRAGGTGAPTLVKTGQRTLTSSGAGTTTIGRLPVKIFLTISNGVISLVQFPKIGLASSGTGISNVNTGSSANSTLSALGTGTASFLRTPIRNLLAVVVSVPVLVRKEIKSLTATAISNVTVTRAVQITKSVSGTGIAILFRKIITVFLSNGISISLLVKKFFINLFSFGINTTVVKTDPTKNLSAIGIGSPSFGSVITRFLTSIGTGTATIRSNPLEKLKVLLRASTMYAKVTANKMYRRLSARFSND